MRDLSDFVVDFLPYYYLIVLPMFIALSPINPVEGSREFPVHRLAHYDLGSTRIGSKVASISLDARGLSSVPNVLRKMIVAPVQNVSISGFNELVQAGIAGLLLVVPPGESLGPAARESVILLEEHFMTSTIDIPVFFTPETEELVELLDELQTYGSSSTTTAFQILLNNVVTSGYQLVTAMTGNPKALSNPGIVTFHGQLSGRGNEDSLPTIVIVTHYDSSGAAPGMSFGTDSNGSGTVILLELARLWNKLYSSSRTHPGYNLVFLLSGGGKVNYFGTKKWLEEHQDNDQSSEVLSNVAFVMCLDSLGQNGPLNFHVSKPPKDGTPAAKFFDHLKMIHSKLNLKSSVKLVHKKINLAEEFLAWEHERFSIRRLQAFTLSSLEAFDSLERNSILDTIVNEDIIYDRTRLIAEAIACTVYPKIECSGQLFEGETLSPSKTSISSLISYLKSTPRATSLLVTSGKSSSIDSSPRIVQDLGEILKSRSHDFKTLISKRCKREVEFTFYDSLTTNISVYRVKPAVFDLILTMGISAYLGLIYLFLIKAEFWTSYLRNSFLVRKSSTPKKSYTNGNSRIKVD